MAKTIKNTNSVTTDHYTLRYYRLLIERYIMISTVQFSTVYTMNKVCNSKEKVRRPKWKNVESTVLAP